MDQQEHFEKPYDHIPFTNRVQKDPPAGHHRFDPDLLTGYLTGEIEVLTPLHIASGGIELTKDIAPALSKATPLIKAFVRSGGVRVIPGSTLKGAVRSIVEAITPSTVGKVGRRVHLPNSDLEEPRKLNREHSASRNLKPPDQNKLSPADRLFGVMDYLGPIQFWDAKQVGDEVTLVRMPSLFSPRSKAVKGRKFYKHGQPAQGNTPVEAVPVGGKFQFRCDFSNLTEAEVGLLVIALGQGEPSFNLKLGGGKSVGYGTVGIEEVRVTNMVDGYLDWESGEESLNPEKLVYAALVDKQMLLKAYLHIMAEILNISK